MVLKFNLWNEYRSKPTQSQLVLRTDPDLKSYTLFYLRKFVSIMLKQIHMLFSNAIQVNK